MEEGRTWDYKTLPVLMGFIQWKHNSLLQHVKSGKLLLCRKWYTLDTLEEHDGESLVCVMRFTGPVEKAKIACTGNSELWILNPKSCHPPRELGTAYSPWHRSPCTYNKKIRVIYFIHPEIRNYAKFRTFIGNAKSSNHHLQSV